MTLSRVGGLAALTCAATYLFGFALLLTLLAPMDYGTSEIDTAAVVAFIHARPGVLILWNSTIYIANALALAVLVVALSAKLRPFSVAWASVAHAIGLIWATLVLGAGMIANVAVEQAGSIYPENPDAAASLWSVLHSVELGLGGGNEIAGAIWILCTSVAGMKHRALPASVSLVGLSTGVGGLATLVPPIGDLAGAVFGLGAIVWFVLIGGHLVRSTNPA